MMINLKIRIKMKKKKKKIILKNQRNHPEMYLHPAHPPPPKPSQLAMGLIK